VQCSVTIDYPRSHYRKQSHNTLTKDKPRKRVSMQFNVSLRRLLAPKNFDVMMCSRYTIFFVLRCNWREKSIARNLLARIACIVNTRAIATDGMAWSVCVLVTAAILQKRLNRSKCRLGTESDGLNSQGTMDWMRAGSHKRKRHVPDILNSWELF